MIDVIEAQSGGSLHVSPDPLTIENAPATQLDGAFTVSFTQNNSRKLRDAPNKLSRMVLLATVRVARRVWGQDPTTTQDQLDDDTDLIYRAVCSSVADLRDPLNVTAISPERDLDVPHTNKEWLFRDVVLWIEYQFSLAVP